MKLKTTCLLLSLLFVFLGVSCQKTDNGGSLYYEPWYLTHELKGVPTLPDVPSEWQGYQIKVPTTYKLEQNGIEIKLDFFQEYYCLGELIQLRMTVTNRSDDTIRYEQGRYGELISGTGIFVRSDGQKLSFDKDYSAQPINGAWVDDSIKTVSCAPGESNVLEYAYVADPDFFCSSGSEPLTFTFYGSILDVEFSIPIEITEKP